MNPTTLPSAGSVWTPDAVIKVLAFAALVAVPAIAANIKIAARVARKAATEIAGALHKENADKIAGNTAEIANVKCEVQAVKDQLPTPIVPPSTDHSPTPMQVIT